MKTFQQFLENQVDLSALMTVRDQIGNVVDINKVPQLYAMPQGKEVIDKIIGQVVGGDVEMAAKILKALGVDAIDDPRTSRGDVFQAASRRMGL